MKNKGGRPSKYSQEIADRICDQLSEGISLRTVCLADDMPDKQTVFSWIRKHKEFLDQYARAKEESADAMAEEILDIADEKESDVQRSRLRVDTRKWIMSKMKPKKYGEKLDVTSGGEKLANSLTTLSNDELEQLANGSKG